MSAEPPEKGPREDTVPRSVSSQGERKLPTLLKIQKAVARFTA